ncbi:hypothetical protein GCM10010275_37570 [Streptomyces litmocidini]|nr:hypothetical protein GCM10010275_37570 [Streptomyces litmocidini]
MAGTGPEVRPQAQPLLRLPALHGAGLPDRLRDGRSGPSPDTVLAGLAPFRHSGHGGGFLRGRAPAGDTARFPPGRDLRAGVEPRGPAVLDERDSRGAVDLAEPEGLFPGG